MERMTKKDEKGFYVDDISVYPDEKKRRRKLVDRLAEYEETGYQPEDIFFLAVQVEGIE